MSSGLGVDGAACSPCLTLHLGPFKAFLIAPLWSRPASSYIKHSSYTHRTSPPPPFFFFFLMYTQHLPLEKKLLNAFSLKQSFIDLLEGNTEWNLPLNCSKATLQTTCTEQSNTFKCHPPTKACIVPGELRVALTFSEWEEFTKT